MPINQTSYLIKLISRFQAPFGLERSVKVANQALLPDRVLLSMHKHGFGDRPGDKLSGLLTELECPPQAGERLQEYIQAAEIIHVGYELVGSRLLYKCYLEFPGHYRSVSAQADKIDGVLVHIAAKWEPGVATAVTFSHYHGFTGLTCKDILEKIQAKIYAAGPANNVLDSLYEIAGFTNKGRVDDIMLMLVTEPGNDRLSFDLNIYNWDYTITDIRSQLDKLMSSFEIPVELSGRYLDRYATDTAGHISAGHDRSGNPFFTLYHGVEEIVP